MRSLRPEDERMQVETLGEKITADALSRDTRGEEERDVETKTSDR